MTELKQDLENLKWMMEHYCRLSPDGRKRAQIMFYLLWDAVDIIQPDSAIVRNQLCNALSRSPKFDMAEGNQYGEMLQEL